MTADSFDAIVADLDRADGRLPDQEPEPERHSAASPSSGRRPTTPGGTGRRFRLTVRQRLLVLAVVLATPLVGQTVVGIQNTNKVLGHEDAIGSAVPAALLLLNIDRDAYQAQLAAERAAELPPGPGRDEELASVEENAGQTGTRFAEFEQLLLGLDGEGDIVADFTTYRDEWINQLDQFLATASDDDQTQAQMLGVTQATFSAMRDTLDLLSGLYEQAAGDELVQLESQAAVTQRTLLLLLGAGLIVSIASSWWVSRSISRAVSSNTLLLEQAARALKAAAGHLRSSNAGTVAQIEGVSTLTTSVSGSVSAVGQVVNEMTRSIEEIAHRTEQASAVASGATIRAQETNATVAKLGESSHEIGQVIEMITSIAKQTNLLALNATIEAARAGSAGKGFAVVANEVKELAKQTAAATDQISVQISTIQADTSSSVEAIEAITQVMEEISSIQSSIASAVDEQTSATNDIARSLNEAVASTGTIAGTVDSVTGQAKAVNPEIEATLDAADQVQNIACDLRTLVG